MTDLHGKKLGILISAAPDDPHFGYGLQLALTARARGSEVYLYLIDEAVCGLDDQRLERLRATGAHTHACGLAIERYQSQVQPDLAGSVNSEDRPLFLKTGLAALNDLVVGVDRFVSFNGKPVV